MMVRADFENLIVEIKEEFICFIQLNRPKALNALNNELFHELAEAIR